MTRLGADAQSRRRAPVALSGSPCVVGSVECLPDRGSGRPGRCGHRARRRAGRPCRRRREGLVHSGRPRPADLAAAFHRHGWLRGIFHVLAVANIPNNVVTASSIQGVSRAVAGAGPSTRSRRSAAPSESIASLPLAWRRCFSCWLRWPRSSSTRLTSCPAAHLRRRAFRLWPLHSAHRRAQRQAPFRGPGGARYLLCHAAHDRHARRGVLVRKASRRTDRRRHRRGSGRRDDPAASRSPPRAPAEPARGASDPRGTSPRSGRSR